MAGARTTDPGTSHQAAASVKDITDTQRAIYILLLAGPANDVEGWACYKYGIDNGLCPLISESGYRSRRAELVALGLVKDSGERVKLPSGRNSIVWSAIAPKRKWWARG